MDGWKSWVLACGGTVFAMGPESFRARIGADRLQELPHLRTQFATAVGATISIGVGAKLSEADRALEAAKKVGGDQIRLYDGSVEEDLRHENDEEGLSKNQAAFHDPRDGKVYPTGSIHDLEGLPEHLQDDAVNGVLQSGFVDTQGQFFQRKPRLPHTDVQKAEDPLNTPAAGGGMTGPSQPSPEAPQAPLTEASEHSENEALANMLRSAPSSAPMDVGQLHDSFDMAASAQGQQDEKEAQMQGQQADSQAQTSDIKSRVAAILKVFKARAPELEQLQDQDPELYQTIVGMLKAMTDMAREASQAPVQKSEILLKMENWNQMALVSPEGVLHDTEGQSHPDWAHENRHLVGFVPTHDSDYKPAAESDGQATQDSEGRIALDHFLDAGWTRIKPNMGVQVSGLHSGNIRTVHKIIRAMAKQNPGRPLSVDDGNGSAHVTVSGSGRPDLSVLNSRIQKSELIKGYPKDEDENRANEAAHQILQDSLEEKGGQVVHGAGPLLPTGGRTGKTGKPLKDSPVSRSRIRGAAAANRGENEPIYAEMDPAAPYYDAGMPAVTSKPTGFTGGGTSVSAGLGFSNATPQRIAEGADKRWWEDVDRGSWDQVSDSFNRQHPFPGHLVAFYGGKDRHPGIAVAARAQPGRLLGRYPIHPDTGQLGSPVSANGLTEVRDLPPETKAALQAHLTQHWPTFFKKPAVLKADLMPGGKADDKTDDDFDPDDLAEGARIEAEEHGLDEARAKEIARDHLTENSQYYKTAKAALVPRKTGVHQVHYPVGSQKDAGAQGTRDVGKIKVQSSADGKTKWRSVRAGLVMDKEGNPISSRNPGG